MTNSCSIPTSVVCVWVFLWWVVAHYPKNNHLTMIIAATTTAQNAVAKTTPKKHPPNTMSSSFIVVIFETPTLVFGVNSALLLLTRRMCMQSKTQRLLKMKKRNTSLPPEKLVRVVWIFDFRSRVDFFESIVNVIVVNMNIN